MTVKTFGLFQRATTKDQSGVDINQLRALIAKHLEIDIRHVTDDAHLGDLGADWLDCLELIILVEEISGVEIKDNEAEQIKMVGDLIHCIDKRLLAAPAITH
jgi:acyl carrier protein